MATRNLANVCMGRTWTSYIASAYGALSSAGWYDGGIDRLMGETGIGFHFIVHKEACPSSVTVYEWVAGHIAAMDRIGVHSDVYLYPSAGNMNTLSLIRRDAVERIKASIDVGRPVIVWAPTEMLEFGLVWGYHDEERWFSVADCARNEADPLPYEKLGCSQVPWLFYQVLRERIVVDPRKVCREALSFGLSQWRKEAHSHPLYASGRKGYENLIALLSARKWNPFGLAYIYAVYSDAKATIAKYLQTASKVSEEWKPIGEAAAAYTKAAGNFKRMAEIHPFAGANSAGGRPVDEARVPELIALAKESLACEEEAFSIIAGTIEKVS